MIFRRFGMRSLGPIDAGGQQPDSISSWRTGLFGQQAEDIAEWVRGYGPRQVAGQQETAAGAPHTMNEAPVDGFGACCRRSGSTTAGRCSPIAEHPQSRWPQPMPYVDSR